MDDLEKEKKFLIGKYKDIAFKFDRDGSNNYRLTFYDMDDVIGTYEELILHNIYLKSHKAGDSGEFFITMSKDELNQWMKIELDAGQTSAGFGQSPALVADAGVGAGQTSAGFRRSSDLDLGLVGQTSARVGTAVQPEATTRPPSPDVATSCFGCFRITKSSKHGIR
jgi:hypothetical protein